MLMELVFEVRFSELITAEAEIGCCTFDGAKPEGSRHVYIPLTSLVFSVRTVSYGPSFFPLIFFSP